MNAVRQKYGMILDNVLNEVEQKHEELANRGKQLRHHLYNVGIGKRAWPSYSPAWPSGLWIGHVRLEEEAADEDDSPPVGIVYVGVPNDVKLDMKEVAGRLLQAANTLRQEEFRGAKKWSAKREANLSYPLSESREKLRDLLVKDEARGFIDCMVAHFESLTEFIPVIDEIFEAAARTAGK